MNAKIQIFWGLSGVSCPAFRGLSLGGDKEELRAIGRVF
jgi:hypothetical protein